MLAGKPGTAAAEPDASIAELDAQARSAFADKRFGIAAQAFRKIFQRRPTPAGKYNEALAWDAARRPELAADAFESFLELEGLDAALEDRARLRLSQLKKVLGYIVVSCPAGAHVNVGHEFELPVPARAHVLPGKRTIRVGQPGGRATTERLVSVRAGQTLEVRLPCGSNNAPLTSKRPDKGPSRAQTTSAYGAWPYVALGAGVALGLAGGYFALDFRDAKEEFTASGNRDADARKRAVRSRALTNVFLGAAVISTGVGVTLLLSSPPTEPQSTAVRPVGLQVKMAL